MFKRVTSLILTAVMLIVMLPASVYAQDPTEYSIGNNYLTYTINTKTGGFSIVTKEGHPDKKYDNNMPLLYKDSRDEQPENAWYAMDRALGISAEAREVQPLNALLPMDVA